MQTDNLFEGVKAGDRQAFMDWFAIHRERVAKFAFQAGLPKQQIGSFLIEVSDSIRKRGNTLTEGNEELILFQSAVQILKESRNDLEDGADIDALKFEEDREAHSALFNLALSERLAVILVYFHGKNGEEAAEILSTPPVSVESSLQTGLDQLRNDLSAETQGDVEKRLLLLDKSYNRLEFPDLSEEAAVEEMHIEKSDEKVETLQKPPGTNKKIALLAGASLFLAAVIGSSFFFNDQPADIQQAALEENPTSVSRAMVKAWEAQYEEIRSSAPERLGLSEETFESLEYVQTADALKDRTFSRQNVRHLKDDPERMQDQVDKLMLSIETPKGMLDLVSDYQLLGSEISEFLLVYTEKTDQLMVIANGLLNKYKDDLPDIDDESQNSVHELTMNKGDYPEEIQNLTESLQEYTFHYIADPSQKSFRTVRDISLFYSIHPFTSDMESIQYLEVMQSMAYVYEFGEQGSIEYMAYPVITMATFLSDSVSNTSLKAKVEPQMLDAFYMLLKGDENMEIFDSKGTVKEEFQNAWTTLVQYHNNNPLTFLMLPILEEFEASGWKKSAHYDQLGYRDIAHAIEMENQGELEEKLPNGDLEIEEASLLLKDYDYTDIEPLYQEFSASHNRNVLSGVQPLEIIKLYFYANKIGDIETMWHLTADDELKPSLETYAKRWRQRPEITETMDNISVHKDHTMRLGRKIVLQIPSTLRGDSNHVFNMEGLSLITERDHIWLMQHQLDEYYSKDDNLDVYKENVRMHYENLLQNNDLDAINDATPGEMGGIFILALENEDIDSMRLLLDKSESQIDEKEFLNNWVRSGGFTPFSELEAVYFRADTYYMQGQNVFGNVSFFKNVEMWESGRDLQMEYTGELWTVSDMFGY